MSSSVSKQPLIKVRNSRIAEYRSRALGPGL